MARAQIAQITDEMIEHWFELHSGELEQAKMDELQAIIEWFPIVSLKAND